MIKYDKQQITEAYNYYPYATQILGLNFDASTGSATSGRFSCQGQEVRLNNPIPIPSQYYSVSSIKFHNSKHYSSLRMRRTKARSRPEYRPKRQYLQY